jgi:mevalonate kinase
MRIVMGNTGLTANTEGAVDGVKKRKKANPERYNQIFIMAEDLYSKARLALAAYDLRTVGQLMNINHTLLQDIEVSHPKLEELVDIARANGAWGAKMTGGGLGGYMVALTPNPELQERVARAMDDAGYEALCTSIGV